MVDQERKHPMFHGLTPEEIAALSKILASATDSCVIVHGTTNLTSEISHLAGDMRFYS